MQIWKFNDIKSRHCQKLWEDSDLRETAKPYIFRKVLTKATQKCNFVKSSGHLSEILAHFTMTTHQIRLTHMTPVANFEHW